jgi:hypothetical protein
MRPLSPANGQAEQNMDENGHLWLSELNIFWADSCHREGRSKIIDANTAPIIVIPKD